MSFYETLSSIDRPGIDRALAASTEGDIGLILGRHRITRGDFLSLLSPAAGNCLEMTAGRANRLTLQYFGRTIQLYTPLYVSDYCDNQCLYCSFNACNRFERKKLTLREVDSEGAFIASTGLRHILLLTGESQGMSPPSYIRDCVQVLNRHFSSVSIEVYPLTEDDYAGMTSVGLDGLTIYQETYDEDTYRSIHRAGPKRDFRFRLDAPERGASAKIRQINIGALLGLADWRKEAFFTGLHAEYLMDRFPDAEIGVSVPRLRPFKGSFQGACRVSDRDLVQIILAFRLFLPRLGISLSTREDPTFRENLMPLGVTRMSAGSLTSVGGHSVKTHGKEALHQFEVADHRSIPELASVIRRKGYEPVMKDWIPFS